MEPTSGANPPRFFSNQEAEEDIDQPPSAKRFRQGESLSHRSARSAPSMLPRLSIPASGILSLEDCFPDADHLQLQEELYGSLISIQRDSVHRDTCLPRLLSELQQRFTRPINLFQLIEYIKRHFKLPDAQLSRLLSEADLKALILGYSDKGISALLDTLNFLEIKPPFRGHQQWDLVLLVRYVPELLSGLPDLNDDLGEQLYDRAMAGDEAAYTELKLFLLKDSKAFVWFIKVALEQGQSLKSLHRELQDTCWKLPEGFKSPNISVFFARLIDNLSGDLELRTALLRQFEFRWLSQVDNRQLGVLALKEMIKLRLTAGEPLEKVLDHLMVNASLPLGVRSWYELIASISGLSSEKLVLDSSSQSLLVAFVKAQSSLQKRRALEKLQFRALHGDGENRIAYAKGLYDFCGRLDEVEFTFNHLEIPSPDGGKWDIEGLKQAIGIPLNILPMSSGERGVKIVDPRVLNVAGLSLDYKEVSDVLAKMDSGDTVEMGQSLRAGNGCIAKVAIKQYQLLGEYSGRVVVRSELDEEHKKMKGIQPDKPVSQTHQHLYVVIDPVPEPHFLTEPDTYTAWTHQIRLMFEPESEGRTIAGHLGYELGVNGEQGGGNFRFLNHDAHHPNVQLLSIVRPECIDWIDYEERIYLKPGTDLQAAIKLVVIAIADIDPNDPVERNRELTFDYGGIGLLNFALVGKDIVQNPEELFEIDPQSRLLRKSPVAEMMSTDVSEVNSISHSDATVTDMEVGLAEPSPDDIPRLSSQEQTLFLADLDNPPSALRAKSLLPNAELVRQANQGDDEALAWLLYKTLSSATYVQRGASGVSARMKELKVKAKPTKQFQMIEKYIPMSRIQLCQLMHGEALRHYSQRDTERVKEFLRYWVCQHKSFQQLVIFLKRSQVLCPPVVKKPNEWSDNALHELLPGLKHYYECLAEETLIELEMKVANDKDANASAFLLDMARLHIEKGLQHYLLGIARRICTGTLGELVTNLNNRKLKMPPEYRERWNADELAKYIVGFVDSANWLTYKDSMPILQALMRHENDEVLRQYIKSQIVEEGVSLFNLVNKLCHSEVSNPCGGSWELAHFADYLKARFPYTDLFKRTLAELYEAIDEDNDFHASEKIELAIRARWREPGAFDAWLLKLEELRYSESHMLMELRRIGIPGNWNRKTLREALATAVSPSSE
ncbi:hypothetical protein [Endozoicomonas numazuensis]|uniref:SET domain-containing protein n=1 Tax=Endozoicomonas numazuensis TaxID=1137799 RepID=A0A081NJW1_9GAMM|nr:hypothetical protein [Endozoicomonas numazuensis]KEQ18734.1 hypothetical protein GZ78_01140 [Endozoicomonas numazuensis]